jgi:hypothetical protein
MSFINILQFVVNLTRPLKVKGNYFLRLNNDFMSFIRLFIKMIFSYIIMIPKKITYVTLFWEPTFMEHAVSGKRNQLLLYIKTIKH